MLWKLACGCGPVLIAAFAVSSASPPARQNMPPVAGAPAIPADLNRSPTAVAVSPDRRWVASANFTSGSVSLVSLAMGSVAVEHACGRGPIDLVWLDDERLLVSLLHDDALAILNVDPGSSGGNSPAVTTAAVFPVGDEPRGLAIRRAGRASDRSPLAAHAFVALSGQDEVAVIDLETREVVQRVPVGGCPSTLAVSPDGRWLVTCSNVPGQIHVHEADTYRPVSRRNVFDSPFNLGNPLVPPGSSEVIVASAINRTFPIREDNIEKGWAIDNRLTKLPLPDGEYWRQQQLGLDQRGDASGDAWGLALSRDGRWLTVTCGGSHELLVLDRERLKFPTGDPGDFLPAEMLDTPGIVRRVALGGRPLGVAAIDERLVAVANYLNNAVELVDLVEARLVRSIPLGGPAEPDLVRRGEAIFYDADRSFDGWFSCHTCHTDGHTSGQTFDTVNDGNYDTFKLTPSLRGAAHTGPWTWHGWQTTLEGAIRTSMHETLSTQRPLTNADVQALTAFLASLEYRSSPHREGGRALSAAALRGGTLFEGKAGCADCHHGEHFTTPRTYQVGLESKRYFYDSFNPPSLRGVYSRRRFLHDGRAGSLEHVLMRYHAPENVAGEKLTEQELSDLLVYLRSL